ncbi:MAG TPA: hypothetical protein DCM87_20300 [Planctomycetes bacterium]|nr:hypothetical protein [Planctomycetota bacterium]
MREERNLGGERHLETRALLRVIGPVVAITGLAFTIAGVGSFFSAFGGGGPPRYFWCVFVGLPLLAIGIGITKFAFLGAVTRYIAGEAAPVAKDTFNYVAEGTQEGVRHVAQAIGEGIAAAGGGRPAAVRRCGACSEDNDLDARFCKSCGAPLAAGKVCPSCSAENDADARFCDRCGRGL